MKFSIKDSFCKWDQILSPLQNWAHLLKKSLMENFIFFVQRVQAFCLASMLSSFIFSMLNLFFILAKVSWEC